MAIDAFLNKLACLWCILPIAIVVGAAMAGDTFLNLLHIVCFVLCVFPLCA